MKITDYPEATELATNDAFIVDNPDDGTRHIPQSKLPWGEGGGSVPATEPAWVSHRNTYRGENLGTVYTEEQKEMVSSGTFDDLYVGDYWTIGGINWRIADINYWVENDNHLVILPDSILYESVYNGSETTAPGYIGSTLFKTGMNQANTIISNAFGSDKILQVEVYLSNAVNGDGITTGIVATNVKAHLMNSIMVVGFDDLRPNSESGLKTYLLTNEISQLSLFNLNKKFQYSIDDSSYWLTDIITSIHAGTVLKTGRLNSSRVTTSLGVRPLFGLTG